MSLTKEDRHTLAQALRLHDQFDMGIFPKGSGQYSHFQKLVRDGFLEVKGWGVDEDGEVDNDVLIHQLTRDGKYEARMQDLTEGHWKSLGMIYLGVPYTHNDEAVRQKRFEIVNEVAARLIEQGYKVFSPISHTHPINMVGAFSMGWEYWETYDTFMLSRCTRMCVVCIDGWRDSKGLTKEIEIAGDLGIEVVYVDENAEMLEGENDEDC